MTREEYEDIIDFAIKREEEAVAFYRQLQDMTDFGAQKIALKEFEDMETGHVKLLNSVRSKGPRQASPVTDFGFDAQDFLVPAEPASDMSFQEIVVTAIKREEKSLTLYQQLQDKTEDPEIANTFTFLAAEEAKHRSFFEDLYETEIQRDN